MPGLFFDGGMSMSNVDIEKMERDLRKNADLFEEIGQKHTSGKAPVTAIDEGFMETFLEYEFLTMVRSGERF